MKRSSTALTGGFSRPGTPARISTDSLRLDPGDNVPEHVVPSPVAESPAREAAQSAPEPTGLSKVLVPPIDPPDSTPAPEPAPAAVALAPASTSTRSLGTRMGTMMRRSSTVLGEFSRPGTPAGSSADTLGLDASANAPELVVPSPFAESPAREAAESVPEPTGPSKLSGPSIAPPDSTPAPEPTSAAVALAPSSDAVPVSLPEPTFMDVPRKSSPEPVPEKSTGAPPYVSRSTESLSRAASEHPDEAPPVRQSEDPGSTQSHGQIISQEQHLLTEVLAAPWGSAPCKHAWKATFMAERSYLEELAAPDAMSSRTNLVSVNRVLTPLLATEAPPFRADNVSNAGTTTLAGRPTHFYQASVEVSSLMLKSSTRGSTVSSQVRPNTPPDFNGRVSRRSSASSLASSAGALSSYPVPAASIEPRQEDVGAVPASRQCVRCHSKVMLDIDIVL